jgi:uncharacterized protein YcfL
MKKLQMITCVFLSCFLLAGCSYNISMAHTSGQATDTIDDAASSTPTISPTVTIPLTP